jgi:hypothetical protein
MSKCTAIVQTCVLGLILIFAGNLCAADEAGAKSTQSKSVKEPDAAAAWQRRLPEFQSDNLPLDEIIKQLRNEFREINFIVKRQNDSDNYISSTSVRMTLRAVTLAEILKAIELASDRPLQIVGKPDERLVIFEKQTTDPSGMPLDAPLATRVYNISTYLAQRPEVEAAAALKELEDVIQTAGHMMTRASNGARNFQPTLSIHPSTKLLIVVGRPEELALVDQVITGLQGPGTKSFSNAGAASSKPAGALPSGNKQ